MTLRHHLYRAQFRMAPYLPLSFPTHVDLELAGKCQLRCGMCNFGIGTFDESMQGMMPRDMAFEALRQAAEGGARVVGEDANFVTAQGVFHDLERNVAITYEVKRRITNRQGRRFQPDMIGVTANAACSIALRNAVFKGIPKALWSEIYSDVRRVVMGDVKTLANRRSDALGYLQKLGVTEEMVCQTLGVQGADDIGLEELVVLRGMATAIREGETTPEQAFGRPGAAQTAQTGKSKLEEALGPPAKTEEDARDAADDAALKGSVEAEASPKDPVDTPQTRGADTPQEETPAPTVEELVERCATATTTDECDQVEADTHFKTGSKARSRVLDALADARRRLEEAG